MIKASITVKSLGGSIDTQDYEFEDMEGLDSWWDELNSDNKKGKVIGIHQIENI